MTHLLAASIIQIARYVAVWGPVMAVAIWLCTSSKGPKK